MMRLAQSNRSWTDVLLPVGFGQRSFVALPLSGKPLRRYLLIRYFSNGGNGFRLSRLRVFKDLSCYLVERERFFFFVHPDMPIAIVTFHIRESCIGIVPNYRTATTAPSMRFCTFIASNSRNIAYYFSIIIRP